jgi:phosphinothricin acetyltransferase
MNIRLATIDDVPEILAISNRAALETAANFAIEPESLVSWRESYAATHDRYPWVVAAGASPEDRADGSQVVGFAKASPWKGRCAYDHACEITIYVTPSHHGRGLGRAIYERLFATLRAQGFHAVLASIALPNPVSVRLHEAFGLRHAGTLARIGWKFGRWHDVGLWQGFLAEPDAPAQALKRVSEAWPRQESKREHA